MCQHPTDRRAVHFPVSMFLKRLSLLRTKQHASKGTLHNSKLANWSPKLTPQTNNQSEEWRDLVVE